MRLKHIEEQAIMDKPLSIQAREETWSCVINFLTYCCKLATRRISMIMTMEAYYDIKVINGTDKLLL